MERPERLSSYLPMEETTWLASRLLRRQVVDVSAAEPAGRVTDLVFDPDNGQVMALVIESDSRARMQRHSRVGFFRRKAATTSVGLDHIIAMDGDIVTVNTNPSTLAHIRELERLPHLNKTCEMVILTMRGTCLGTLADLLLENQGATIAGYVVSPTAAGEEALPALAGRTELPSVAAESTLRQLRVIPADSRLRISGSLIMLLDDVAPLGECVVITPQASLTAKPAQPRIGSPALNGA